MEKIQKEIDNQIEYLNSEDFDHYKDYLTNGQETERTTYELVMDADIEGEEFNLGFEQGYMRGLEIALSLTQK